MTVSVLVLIFYFAFFVLHGYGSYFNVRKLNVHNSVYLLFYTMIYVLPMLLLIILSSTVCNSQRERGMKVCMVPQREDKWGWKETLLWAIGA